MLSRLPSRSARRIASRSFASAAAAAASAPSRPLRLEGRVSMITGAGGGIGREASLLFAAEGSAVVCSDINPDAATATAEAILAQGGRAVAVRADVSSEADVAAAVELAEREFGKCDVVFNNAGVMDSRDDDEQTTTDEVWDLTFDVNVKGVWYGCKHGIAAIKRADAAAKAAGEAPNGGAIINTASFVGLVGAATPQIAYTASKGAVLAMTRELAVLHAREKIRVNALCPGPLHTPLLMKFLDTEEKRQRRLVHLPMGRFGEAKEMAQGALFLASNEASYVTGTEFMVDGGLTSAYVTAE